MIELVASRYRVLRELGRGGMGVVYVVEHVHTGEQLALKVLHGHGASDPDATARFRREARVGAQIRSEHVVRVTDADVAPELNGAPFFVMELLDGVDLEKLVGKVGPLHPDVVVALLAQVAKALDKAHALGIVHRDLKPENIFIHRRQDEPPIVKVLDFGISKFLRPNAGEQSSLGATSAGTLMGTPYYMAPEQARGDVDAIGPATDVWSMGLVALRLLTAEIYWTARTHADLMVDLLAAPMQAPSARWPFLGGKLDSWFARSCHRDPRGRWRTVGEQVKALGDAFEAGDRRNAASMDAIVDLLNGLSSGNHEASPPSAVRQNGPLAGSPSPNQSPNPKTPTVTARVPNLEVAGIPSPIGHTTARGNLARTTNEGGAWNRRRRITVAAVLLAATLIAVAAYGLLMTTSAGPTATPASGVSVDRAGAAPAEAPEPAARVTEAAKPVVAEPEPVPAASADLRAPVRHSGPAARPAPRATPPKPRATSTAPVPTPVPTDDPLRP